MPAAACILGNMCHTKKKVCFSSKIIRFQLFSFLFALLSSYVSNTASTSTPHMYIHLSFRSGPGGVLIESDKVANHINVLRPPIRIVSKIHILPIRNVMCVTVKLSYFFSGIEGQWRTKEGGQVPLPASPLSSSSLTIPSATKWSSTSCWRRNCTPSPHAWTRI